MAEDREWRAKFHARWVAAGEPKVTKMPPPPVPTPPPEPEPPWEPDLDAPTIIGMDENGDAVTISAEDRCEHQLLLGKTGQGKSVLMRSWMRQDIEAGRGFCCFDAHGSLLDGVLRDIPRRRQGDVIYLDASDDEWPFGLNLFAPPRNLTPKAKSVLTDQLVQVFKKTWEGQWATTTGDWLKVIASTFIDNRHGTIANIPKLLTDEAYRETFMPRLKDVFARQAWEAAINPKTGTLMMTDIRPTLLRMRNFLMNPVLTNIVGQQKTTLDFASWMREGKIVLIRLPGDGDEGIGEAAVELIGTVMMQLILRGAFSRKIGDPLWPVYCDEFQHYVTPDMPKIIMNVRKYGVGIFLATQSFANIPDEITDAVLAVGTHLCYQMSEKDARIMAGEFRRGIELAEDWQETIKSEIIGGESYRYQETVYRRPNKTETASRIANLQALLGKGWCLAKTSKGEFVVRVPNVEEIPVAGPIASRGVIIRDSRKRYCRPRWEVEREILDDLFPEDTGPEDEGVLFDDAPPLWG